MIAMIAGTARGHPKNYVPQRGNSAIARIKQNTPCVYEGFFHRPPRRDFSILHLFILSTIPTRVSTARPSRTAFFLTIWPGWTGKVLVFRVYIVFKQNEFNVL